MEDRGLGSAKADALLGLSLRLKYAIGFDKIATFASLKPFRFSSRAKERRLSLPETKKSEGNLLWNRSATGEERSDMMGERLKVTHAHSATAQIANRS